MTRDDWTATANVAVLVFAIFALLGFLALVGFCVEVAINHIR